MTQREENGLCAACEKKLERDEIGASKKLINRETETFYCTDCLAARFKIRAEDIKKLIENFKRAGCTLFT